MMTQHTLFIVGTRRWNVAHTHPALPKMPRRFSHKKGHLMRQAINLARSRARKSLGERPPEGRGIVGYVHELQLMDTLATHVSQFRPTATTKTEIKLRTPTRPVK